MELLTIKEVMDMFHLTKRKTIDNWLYSGTLPRSLTVRIGRHVFFIKDKLEDFLKTVNEEQAANI
jgi:predicted DNA-binding transcriptional regulator AlpA